VPVSPPTARLAGAAAIVALLAVAALLAAWLANPGTRQARWTSLRKTTQRALGMSQQTQDPALVRQAMALWHELVYVADGTPRGTLRYRNNTRLFGTLLEKQLGEAEAASKRARVHAAALVALNFLRPDWLALVIASEAPYLTRASVAAALAGQPKDGFAPEDPAVKRQRDDLLERLARHESDFGPIPRQLLVAFQSWAGTIQVR
jgi:hypothetical protein